MGQRNRAEKPGREVSDEGSGDVGGRSADAASAGSTAPNHALRFIVS